MFIELSYKYSSDQQGTAVGQNQITRYFLMDFQSGWEIYDNGSAPAHWTNNVLGMNKSTNENYAQIKAQLIKAGLLIE